VKDSVKGGIDRSSIEERICSVRSVETSVAKVTRLQTKSRDHYACGMMQLCGYRKGAS